MRITSTVPHFVETAAKASIVQRRRVVVDGDVGQKQTVAVAIGGAARVAFGSGKNVAAVERERSRGVARGVAVVAADAGDGVVRVTKPRLVRQTIGRGGGVERARHQVLDLVATGRGKGALEGVAVLGKFAILEVTVALLLLAVVIAGRSSGSNHKRRDIFSIGDGIVVACACKNN